MKKNFFAAFFGLFFCLFVGSASASAVEIENSPLTLSSNSSLLSITTVETEPDSIGSQSDLPMSAAPEYEWENYPVKKFSWFPLTSEWSTREHESAEFYYRFRVDDNGKFRYKMILSALSLTEEAADPHIEYELSYYMPKNDPDDGHYGPYYGDGYVAPWSTKIFEPKPEVIENLRPNGRGWIKFKIIHNKTYPTTALFKLGLLLSRNDTDDMTIDEVRNAYNY